MKDDWERQSDIIFLTKHDLQKILHSYDPSIQVTDYLLLSEGLSHTNYKVYISSKDQHLVVRLTKNRENLLMEDKIHKLLYTEDSVPVLYFIGEYEGVYFGLLEWKEGILLKKKLSTYNSLEAYNAGLAIGGHLSSFKQYKFEKSGFFNADLKVIESFELTPVSFIKTIDYFLYQSKAQKWIKKGMRDEIMHFCQKHSNLFLEDNSGPRLVHGDFNGLNILMDNKSVSAILDWEFCFAGSMYFDIGNLLRYEHYLSFSEFKRGLHKGLFENGENLPESWEQIAKLADLIALCSMLDNDFGGANRVTDINRLISKTLNSDKFA